MNLKNSPLLVSEWSPLIEAPMEHIHVRISLPVESMPR